MGKIDSLENIENGLEVQPLLSKKKLKSTEISTTCNGKEKEETKSSIFAVFIECIKVLLA